MSINLDKATRDELRAEAARLDIAGRGSMTKGALIEAITAHRLDANNARDEAQTPVVVQDSIDHSGPVPAVTRQLPPDIARLFDSSAPVTPRKLNRAMRARGSKHYGPSFGGRGMGAKHYPSGGYAGKPLNVGEPIRAVVMSGALTTRLRIGAL